MKSQSRRDVTHGSRLSRAIPNFGLAQQIRLSHIMRILSQPKETIVRNFLIIVATLVGLCALSVTAVMAAVNKCDVAWTKCNMNAGKCQDPGRCMIRCDQKYAICKP